MEKQSATPHIPRPFVTFLRTVAERKPAPRGSDGGYIVPRHLYSHLLDAVPPLAASSARPAPRTRVYALTSLANTALFDDDEGAARATIAALIQRLSIKLDAGLLHYVPLELEASGDATYKDNTGQLRNAFACDETVFRLSLRIPATQPDQSLPASAQIKKEAEVSDERPYEPLQECRDERPDPGARPAGEPTGGPAGEPTREPTGEPAGGAGRRQRRHSAGK